MYCKEPIYGPMAADDIVNGVLTAGLRPQIPADTPFVFIKLIESCWQTDPNLRCASVLWLARNVHLCTRLFPLSLLVVALAHTRRPGLRLRRSSAF